MTEPESAFLQEGATMLQVYYGIQPFKNALDAAEATWHSVLKCQGMALQCWSDVHEHLDHPQVQANLAYWRAMGPWLAKQGLGPIPEEEGDEELPPPQATVPEKVTELHWAAELEVKPVARPLVTLPKPRVVEAPKPLPKIIPLKEDNFVKKPRAQAFHLNDPLRQELVSLADLCVRSGGPKNKQELQKKIGQVAEAVRDKDLRFVDVIVGGLVDFSPPAYLIVTTWMDEVRLRPDFEGLKIFFKFR